MLVLLFLERDKSFPLVVWTLSEGDGSVAAWCSPRHKAHRSESVFSKLSRRGSPFRAACSKQSFSSLAWPSWFRVLLPRMILATRWLLLARMISEMRWSHPLCGVFRWLLRATWLREDLGSRPNAWLRPDVVHQGQGGAIFSYPGFHLIDAEFREAWVSFFCKSGHGWIIFLILSTPLFFKSGFWTFLGLLAGSSRGCSCQEVDCWCSGWVSLERD